MSKLEQIKALKKGKGIQHLLDSASMILGNPIAMFDRLYTLIAHTDTATDDPLWQELVSTGTFNMATQEFFLDECFTLDVANMDRLVVLKSDKLKYERTLAYVFNNRRIRVALIVMVACNAPLLADDLMAFGTLAEKITSEIRDDEHYVALGRIYHDTIIKMILEGDIKDPRFYAAHIQILYEGLKNYLYLAVADIGESDMTYDKLMDIRSLLESRNNSFKFAIYSDYIIMLMSSMYSNFNARRVLNKHNDLFEQHNIVIGVSSAFENLYELRKYFDEAVDTLKNGINSGSDIRVFLFMENKERE